MDGNQIDSRENVSLENRALQSEPKSDRLSQLQNNLFNERASFIAMSKEDEYAIIKRAKEGSEDAKNVLRIQFLPMINKLASEFVGRGMEFGDLVNYGHEGIQKAIKGFDFSKDVRFSTYAYPWVHSTIKRAIDNGNDIGIQPRLRELAGLL